MDHLVCLSLCLLAVAATLCTNAHAAPSPRLHERFDAEWRFYKEDAPEAWNADFDDSG
jgi:carbonic anhydrase